MQLTKSAVYSRGSNPIMFMFQGVSPLLGSLLDIKDDRDVSELSTIHFSFRISICKIHTKNIHRKDVTNLLTRHGEY